jgi:Tfp pilus assembly PilM family ATPase/Tfp pilus assembly protein PilN
VAIDYDRKALRLAVFELSGKEPTILALHSVPAPAGADTSDPAVLGRLLKTMVDRLKLRGSLAMMCVGRGQAVLKTVLLPPGSQESELAAMVQFQVAKELPFGADEAVVDFTVGKHWGGSEPREGQEAPAGATTVLAAAIRLPVLDAARQACQDAGLKLVHLGLRPYANLRCVYRCVRVEPGEAILFVDITADEAEIDVLRDQALEFSRTAKLAAPPAAGEAASTNGSGSVSPTGRIVAEVVRSLQGYSAANPGGKVDACLVAGATGVEKEVVAALTEKLGVHCEQFDPCGGFGIARGPDVTGFGAALGLAAEPESLPFDFLYPKRPVPVRDTRKLKMLAAVSAVAVVLGLTFVTRAVVIGGKEQAVTALSEQSSALDKDIIQLTKLADRVKTVQKWQEDDTNWLDQLAHLSNLLPGCEEVYLTSFKAGGGRITIQGQAKEDRCVTSFATELQSLGGYEVKPKGTLPRADKYGYTAQFTMEIEVTEKAKPIVASTQPVGRPADDAAGKPQPPGPRPRVGPAQPNQPNPAAPAGGGVKPNPGTASPSNPGAGDRPRRRPNG